MRVEPSIITRQVIVALLVSGLAVPVFGQEPADPQDPPPAAPEPSAEPAEPTDQVEPPPMPLPTAEDGQELEPNTRQLSIDDAVQLALEHNLGLRVDRVNPLLADLDVAESRSNWTPRLTSTWSNSDSQSPPESFLEGGDEVFNRKSWGANFAIEQTLPWGTFYSVGFENNGTRTNVNTVGTNFNPQRGTNLALSFTQPLLQGFRIDGTRQSFIINQMRREMSDVDLRNSVVSTVRSVRNAYWDLVNAHQSLRVSRETLAVSEQQLRDNRKRVEVGTMAPIEVIQIEAEVAQNESNVIAAEADVEQAEDALRTLLADPSAPDYWSARFEPTDMPEVRLEPVDIDAAMKNALGNRTDIRNTRTQLEINDVSINYARHQRLPSLSLQVDYRAQGRYGTELQRSDPLAPPDEEITISYRDALGDVFGFTYPQWTVALNFSYPLGRSAEDVSLARNRMQQERARLQLRDLERNVAQQIRDLGRQVNTNIKLVESTGVGLELAERNLDAAQKRFAVGLATQFEVIQMQRDLANARFQELGARINYAKSVVDFEAAQEAGTGGIIDAPPTTGTGGAPTGPINGMGGTEGAGAPNGAAGAGDIGAPNGAGAPEGGGPPAGNGGGNGAGGSGGPGNE